MSHYRKEDPTPFDNLPVPGLNFTISEWLLPGFDDLPYREYKFAQIEFPSGEGFAVYEGDNAEFLVRLFGDMKLGYFLARDKAFDIASQIAETKGYTVNAIGDSELELIGPDVFDHYVITFNNEQQHMLDIVYAGEGI